MSGIQLFSQASSAETVIISSGYGYYHAADANLEIVIGQPVAGTVVSQNNQSDLGFLHRSAKVTSIEEISISRKSLLIISSAPNPVRENFELTFYQENPAGVQIEIVNMLGEKVFDNFCGMLSSGENKVKIDLSGQSAGAYQLRVKSGGFSDSALIIKL